MEAVLGTFEATGRSPRDDEVERRRALLDVEKLLTRGVLGGLGGGRAGAVGKDVLPQLRSAIAAAAAAGVSEDELAEAKAVLRRSE